MNQIILNSLVSAGIYLLVALGFSLIYNTARFFHFAHGIVITVGAYATFTLIVIIGLPIWLSIIGGITTSALLGTGMEWAIYKPLRIRGGTSLILLLTSLGIYTALQAIISIIYGSGTQTFRFGVVPESFLILGARITFPQVMIVGSSMAGCFIIWLLLIKTNIGLKIRAIASDSELAADCGVNQNRVICVVFFLGSTLAGIIAVLLAYDTDITPLMGFRVLLMGMIVTIIGGGGSIPGAACGALLLSLMQHLSAWMISSRWQDAIVFLVLILFLLIRPQGMFGKPRRNKAM